MGQTISSKSDVFSFLDNVSKKVPCGELRFKNEKNMGKIYLHQGKVVWAFASGQPNSFQNILISEQKISKERLFTSINSSREAGNRHLEDILITVGVDSEESRKDIIRRHTEAAIEELVKWGSCKVKITKSKPEDAGNPQINFPISDFFPLHKTIEEKPVQQTKPIDSIEDFLGLIKTNVQGFIAATIVDAESGCPIASKISGQELDLDTASAFYRDVAKASHDALIALGKADDSSNPIREILITGTTEHVLLSLLNSGEQVLYLLLGLEGNPGKALLTIRNNLPSLEEHLA